MPPDPPLYRTTSAYHVPVPNPARMRTYLFRLPLFTRLMLLAIFGLWLLELQTVWSVIEWGSLIPKEVGFGSMYRLNTYPLVHNGFLHMITNVVCLAPLLERFEAEWGTFNCVALFLGRKLDLYSSPRVGIHCVRRRRSCGPRESKTACDNAHSYSRLTPWVAAWRLSVGPDTSEAARTLRRC